MPLEPILASTTTTNDPGVGPADPESNTVHLFCSQHRQPKSPLNTYIATLSAPSYEFIALLRITTRQHADFGVPELVGLAVMPNLGVLEIIECVPDRATGTGLYYGQSSYGTLGSQQVNDRLVRGWSSVRRDPFPALRVLRLLGCCGDTLSQACLQYAAQFPLLAQFDVSVKYRNQQTTPSTWPEAVTTASAHGWITLPPQKYGWEYYEISKDSKKISDSIILTLNMAEDGSAPVEALHWGSRTFSFLAQTGYSGEFRKELLMQVAAASSAATGRLDGHFASMSLGGDQITRNQALSAQGDDAFCFVRTRDALAMRVASTAQWTTTETPPVLTGDPRKPTDPSHPSVTAKKRKMGKSIGSLLSDFTT